ncbi:MAG: nucleotidyltransferase [Agathobacter sp.]
MKVVGIIAEYNPFHNGHKYQIEELKKRTGADYCIVVMSGNFLQRGVPALCNKYERARMALSCGADLVLELPTLWATSSAELFAKGGVQVLANTGVVTHLGFGAETDDLMLLETVSSILREEPEDYTLALRKELRVGVSFPVARKKAILETLSEYDTAYLEKVLSSPNNILAIEYLKALPEEITPVLVKRKGAGYHDTSLDTELPSASAIRQAIFTNSSLGDAMPEEAYAILTDCIKRNAIVEPSDLSDIMGYRLLSLQDYEYTLYADCSRELANTIQKNIANYQDFASFCQAIKSKNYTYTRISRTLLHILLGIKAWDVTLGQQEGYAPYLRVLGFRKEAAELLSAIKKEAQSPLISKPADYTSYFNGCRNFMMELDLKASAIYQQILTTKKGQPPANDYTSQIIVL